jgi:Ca2+/Na+ antiporter
LPGRLVRGAIGTARGFGLSAFLIAVIFIGFDPENLAVGAAGGATGIALLFMGAAIVATVLSLAGTAAGREMVVRSSRTITERLGITDTFCGIAIMAFLISIEEVTRELPAVLQGHHLRHAG